MLHAIGLARCGEWSLLDALEVEARATAEPKLAGILHARGSPGLLGYCADEVKGEPSKCEECDGDGEVIANGSTGREKWVCCPWCGGSGEPDESEPAPAMVGISRVKVWKDFGGHKVKESEHGFSGAAGWIDRAKSAAIIREYSGLVERLAA